MSFCRQKYYIQKLLSIPDYNFKFSLPLVRSYMHGKESLPVFKIHNVEDYNPYSEEFKEILKYYDDKRIIYNCFIDKYKPKFTSFQEKEVIEKIKHRKKIDLYEYSIPLIVEKLKHVSDSSNVNQDKKNIKNLENNNSCYDKKEQFPFSKFEKMNLQDFKEENTIKESETSFKSDDLVSVKEDIEIRLKTYNENKDKVSEFPQMSLPDEELPYKYYKDTLLSDLEKSKKVNEESTLYSGTSNPDIPKSSVPCGGCGSHLHCQDEGLPGYIPYEEFFGKSGRELRSLLCQRCYFLKEHKAALNVRVSPEIYKEALKPITNSHALVIVMVDLFDFPCSIWPELPNLIGTKRPVVVVGNKVDLLPVDNVDYLKTIQRSLIHSIKETPLSETNIAHVCVVSAKTGFGIEDLISNLQVKWGVKGDIYLLGCTNTGKSTLFNAFLRSDLCKIQASSLIRRATASPWPGTTLNLLKFPLMRPSGQRLFNRKQRIENTKENQKLHIVPKGRYSPKEKQLTLSGHIGQTFKINPLVDDTQIDPFDVNPFVIPKEPKEEFGINEKSPDFKDSKWCFDTPGTVQPDQFLGLLTHEELLDVLPKKTIQPRTFALRNSQSLFLGGLVRLDLLYSPTFSARITVCCSHNIPVTIVRTSDASGVYRSFIGSSLFSVPRGGEERMKKWPNLKPTNVRIKGISERSADIVLSSAGFVCVSGGEDEDIDFRAWTPGGRGVYVRTVSMLPFVSKLIGKRMRKSQMYHLRTPMKIENI